MIRHFSTWMTVFLCMLPMPAGALFQEVNARRLDNGMQVILMPNHKAPVVTFQVWYRTGSRHDPWGKTGQAHVFEHMMFKGTPKVSGEDFTRIIQENGGQFNAFTSHDYAGYYATTTADRAGVVMELEADRMQHLVLKPEEFQTERNVVMEERRLRVEDNPQALLAEQVDAAAFLATPYHWPVIGWMDDLERLSVEDARQYYQTYYTPGNAFIVAAGDFETEGFFEQVKDAFGAIPAGEKQVGFEFQDPPQRGERIVHVDADAQQPALLMAFHVPRLGDPDAYILEVIAAVLSAGKSSRLYSELVLEKELAFSADASNSLLSLDPNLFYVSAVPMRGKTTDAVRSALLEQLDRLKTEPVEDHELRKAKNQLETAFVFSQDSLFYQAMLLARYEIAGGWEQIKKYLPAIRKVTAQDIQRVAAAYFMPNNRTVGFLHPRRRGQQTPEADIATPPSEETPGRSP